MNSIRLLRNGRLAFEAILDDIARARRSVTVHMFIWRDDDIGCRLARALLDAADRGVRIDITVDRVGAVLEYSEESGRSMFHLTPDPGERFTAAALSLLYPGRKKKKAAPSGLGEALRRHPRVTVHAEEKRADHSKFHIIDETVLYLGGVNIEDKENGMDARGITYQDYMMRLSGADAVQAFLTKRNERRDVCLVRDFAEDAASVCFPMNRKEPVRFFEMESHYLALIGAAQRELTIVMAYFAPVPAVMDAILAASARGVRVRIMIAVSANYQDDKNKRTVRSLMHRSGGRIEVFLSPMMLHTKLILSDDTVSVGSCNITRKSLYELDEMNLSTADRAFVDEIRADVEANLAGAHRCASEAELHYDALRAWMEDRLA